MSRAGRSTGSLRHGGSRTVTGGHRPVSRQAWTWLRRCWRTCSARTLHTGPRPEPSLRYTKMHRGTPSPRSTVSPNKQRSSGALRRRDGSVLPSSVPCPRVVSRVPVVPECPRVGVRSFCTVFKAARRAARAAATARSPSLPLALPLRRRQRRSAGAKSIKPGPLDIQQVSSAGGASLLPLPGLSGAGQNPSRPSVTAGQPHPSSCLVNVHAKTALTEPARTRSWQLSGAGTRVARTLDA